MLGFYGNFYGKDCFLATPIREKSLALGLDLLAGIRKQLRMRHVVITTGEAHTVTHAMEPASMEFNGDYVSIKGEEWEVEVEKENLVLVNGM